MCGCVARLLASTLVAVGRVVATRRAGGALNAGVGGVGGRGAHGRRTRNGDRGSLENRAVKGLQSQQQHLLGLVLNDTLTLLVDLGVADGTDAAEVVLEISPVQTTRKAINDEAELGAVWGAAWVCEMEGNLT